MTDETIEKLKREKGRLEDDLRKATKARFFRALETPESMLTTAYAAALLNISERTIYRWKASDLWLPRVEDLETINGFLSIVEEVRTASALLVKIWKKEKLSEAFPLFFKRGLLGLSLARAMEDVTLTDGERAEIMTGFILKKLCDQLIEARKSKES